MAIAAFYFVWFAALGIFLPYAGLYFRSLGFSETDASLLLALIPAMALVTPPLVGLVADARSARLWLLRGATALSAITFAGLAEIPRHAGFLAAAVIVALFALARGPVGSLTDASAAEGLASQPGGAAAFGRLRLWGSVGFLVAVLGGGALFDRFGLGLVRLLTLSMLALATALAWLIPAARIERRPDALPAWLGLVRDAGFRHFLVAVALAQAAAAGYDACFSLYLARLGCSQGAIGLAWAIGVVAEVVVLHRAGALVRRYGAPTLFAASILVAAIRWAALSLVSGVAGVALISLPAVRLCLLALQPLHGITFGLWFVCAVHIARERGRSVPTAAQGLLAGASSLGSTLGMAIAGQLLAAGGGRLLYAVAALVAGAGALTAARFAFLAKRSPTGKLVDESGP